MIARLTFLLCVTLCWPQDVAAAETIPVRVMSFNVRYGSANDGPNDWDHRKDRLVETISKADPDLLGTQEILPFQAAYIQQHLPGYHYIGRSRERDNPDGEQSAVFVRASRFKILEPGYFWLSETPDEPGSKSWDSSLPRMVTWVKLLDLRTEREFYFANTHFDHRGALARLQSAKLVERRLKSFATTSPVILSGDFNCGEDSEPYAALVRPAEGAWLIDTYRSRHAERRQDEGTFNGFTGQHDGERIDWILVSQPTQVIEAAIIRTPDGQPSPSDHDPVTCLIELPAAVGDASSP